ncbi:SpoIIE family protein phosphatase [Parvicella tangerina]|uniref:PPM-type phosphatase domain-containing protein n=1 Tax=Parvicella tangerina TaxID=2829795 RepID=A0A916JMC5_9FLAO|nr:SpoIIE family protein phosphatase [Parvicella tangerina]CAG5081349.1 hypothetical protein CRYO30217_01603 [Parvicella tangerina]
MKKINLRILALVILGLAGAILSYLIYDINKTEKSLAQSLLQKPMESAEVTLNGFFEPIEGELESIKEQAQLGILDSITPRFMNGYFGPVIKHYHQVSSMGLANTDGFEFDVLPSEDDMRNRVVWVDKWGNIEKWSSWDINADKNVIHEIDKWTDSLKHDPRVRPWFKGAIAADGAYINWTEPYIYNTTNEVGITASLAWKDKYSDKKHIIAYDLTLHDISEFTQNISISKHGKMFVLSSEGKFIGLPNDPAFDSKEERNNNILKSVSDVNVPAIQEAYTEWSRLNQADSSFEFVSQGDYWWGKLTYYELSPGNSLIVGVIVPEKDILSEVERTKRIIIGGFLFVLILTGFVLYSYGQSKKANRALAAKNKEIEHQKLLIQEKSQEITDSIIYAKRIQSAILPPDHEVKRLLPNSFILYKPKDIVAGDFYWLEEKDGHILIAAADCTGHGVPGAMVSVVCKNGLSRSVREYKELEPGRILDRTREIVIAEFEKSHEEVKDGMDIALCAIKGNTVKYAGAHNPLWIVRKGSDTVEEIKACKQPIGKFHVDKPFKTHEVVMNEGDTIYFFSDGYADQFGGEKGKKFKTGRFKKLVLSMQHESMKKQKKIIDQKFEKWKGDLEQLDDLCVIGIRF